MEISLNCQALNKEEWKYWNWCGPALRDMATGGAVPSGARATPKHPSVSCPSILIPRLVCGSGQAGEAEALAGRIPVCKRKPHLIRGGHDSGCDSGHPALHSGQREMAGVAGDASACLCFPHQTRAEFQI